MSGLYNRGLVALSADPITNGHLDLIRRSAERCNELVVLIANNDRKLGSYTYKLSERTAMTERALKEAGIGNVRVIGSSGLLVDVYLREGCDRLFRGVRDDKDLAYEEEQAELNAMILPQIDGHIEYLKADERLRLISSTIAKGFVNLYLDADRFVPMFVKQSLEERLLGQYRIGVTGGIAVGKSWVAAALARKANESGVTATHLNVDQLLRDVYDEDSPGAQELRDTIAHFFDTPVLTEDRKRIDRAALAERLFTKEAKDERDAITRLTMPHVARKYREALVGVKGLVIVEWAQLAEMEMGPWTNNNAIVVDSSDRPVFISRRKIDPRRIAVMDTIQWRADRKTEALCARILKDHSGTVIPYENLFRDTEEDAREDIAELFFEVMQLFPGLSASIKS